MNNIGKNLLWYIAMIIISIFVLFPVYLILMIALAPSGEIFNSSPVLIPSTITFSRFFLVFEVYDFMPHLILSLETAFMVSGICLLFGIPGAYAISKMPKRLGYSIIIFLFITQMVPEIVIAIPIAKTMLLLGIYNTAFGIALAQSSIALPMITYVLVGTFKSVPVRLSESAQIDGANKLQAFYSIDLPLALTGIYVAVILAWLFSWDEFVLASIIAPLHTTLPVLIYYEITRGVGGVQAADAFSIILIIPVIVLVLVLQRYLKSNVFAGALK